VDADLWNEHFARYAFASRFSNGKRVLDVGCGAGYGAVELSRSAAMVSALDVAEEALSCAKAGDAAGSISWVQGSAAALPFASGSFDLVVAFEVIEHLEAWRTMLEEIRRLLAPGGRFVVSTPNKSYYEESRRRSGPNPFHHHEFEYGEFHTELAAIFPHVSLFAQNHAEAIVFAPVDGADGAEVRAGSPAADAHEAHFFVAVCGLTPVPGAGAFVYVPRTANILRERERHIERLEGELRTKDEWLAASRSEHQELVALHREQKSQLEKSNLWSQELNEKLHAAGQRIFELQDEVAAEQAAASERIAALEADHASAVQWARDTEARLQHSAKELARCVDLLHEAERTVEERTNWALGLDREKQALEGKVNLAIASRWLRLGRAIGLGPQLQDR
jgi:ubiquinone/menaquinone biosynthesis C-methylase UbiE